MKCLKKLSINTVSVTSLFTGGESPFSTRAFFDIIKYGSGKGISVNFTTNATLVKENTNELLGSGLEIVAFSLPDILMFTPEIRHNIEHFITCRNSSRKPDSPKTYINAALMERNFDTVEKVLSVSKELGVDAINFERSYPWRPEYTEKEETIFKKITDAAEKTDCKVVVPLPHTLPCRLFNTTLFMRWNGDITPCCYRPDHVLGNIMKDDFDDIISKREKFWKNMATDQVCTSCGI
ncbi:MoaA/NifB/PqqE/SkfB family radical SAM enzyme [Methanomicrobium sp. W14]|uniref:radical SAM/SPASM domain-containing protein n=1 Tax=Methanomicrobium sp. W14 TaxID=2817839 RepID=UPI001FD929D5|nr:radical SAM/SPASM domain-containing protein [Methanomicrobium sp. W14]MBP2132712.1 MoaA/NifB/PqqE/SkfB family radical SAM enzyme [Methanomicrobium sp. W14]